MYPSFCPGKIYLHRGSVDMRKSFEGLGGIVESSFPGELLGGSMFVFINRRRTHVKILSWDGDGFVLWYKRLERGMFPNIMRDSDLIDRRQLAMLLEGITPKRMNRRFSIGENKMLKNNNIDL
jgi:transposase